MKFSDPPSQDEQAAKQHKLFWLTCKYDREEQQALVVLLVREHHLAWQRHDCLQASGTRRWFFRSSSMQRFNSTKRVELMPWKMVYLFTSCQKKKLLPCCNNAQQTGGLVRLMQFFSQGNLRKAENKSLYIIFAKQTKACNAIYLKGFFSLQQNSAVWASPWVGSSGACFLLGQNITAFLLEMGTKLHPWPGPPWSLVGRAASWPVRWLW